MEKNPAEMLIKLAVILDMEMVTKILAQKLIDLKEAESEEETESAEAQLGFACQLYLCKKMVGDDMDKAKDIIGKANRLSDLAPLAGIK